MWVVFGGFNAGKTYRIIEKAKRIGGTILCTKKNIDMIIEAGIQPSQIQTQEEALAVHRMSSDKRFWEDDWGALLWLDNWRSSADFLALPDEGDDRVDEIQVGFYDTFY